MNYKLAKELKEAGFLQELRNGSDYYIGDNPKNRHYKQYTPPNEDDVKVPTLKELIESCGDDFGTLTKGADLKLWQAFALGIKINSPLENTPEEAVAKLWLELNKKK